MALLKWLPYKDLLFLQERMGRIFDEALSRYVGADELSLGTWTPPADLYETEEHVILKVELAGIEIEDVDVEVKDNILTIKGEREPKKTSEGEHYHRMESSYGHFQRSFKVTTAINKDEIKAKLTDGVLTITIPKVKKQKSKHIKVEVK